MKLIERSFELHGPQGLGAKPRPELIGPVLTHLRDRLQDSVRMGFLHSSRPPGRIAAPLKAAAEVRFLGHSAAGSDGTRLRFEVPSFGSAASRYFQQQRLWDDGPQPEQTAFELLGAALHDVRAGSLESDRFDPPLLRRLGAFGRRMLKLGIERIALVDAALPDEAALDAQVATAARDLSARTPQSRRIRITGRLDVMGASQGLLKVHLRPGEAITALWEGPVEIDSLRGLFNQDVVIEGEGVFRPSGSLLRLDADAIAAAQAQDEFFRRLPTGLVERDFRQAARLRPDESSAYARLFGSLPAEETDEEFEAALATLR